MERWKLNMATNSHALLSASSSARWLNCPPSARLSEEIQDVTSEFAAEGTDAHALCEYKLRKVLGLSFGEKLPYLEWYSQEMEDSATDYVAYILELLSEVKKTCKNPMVLIEQRLDFSRYVQEGFGTGDCVIVSNGYIHIVDVKYGKGIPVDADHNPQMMLYALGALELFGFLFDINKVSMTIYQPRIGNISTYEMATESLLEWAENTLAPIAKLAYAGKGEFKCGPHCRFCKVKAQCRERADTNMKLASLDFAKAPVLQDDEVEEILAKVDDLVSWANDIKEYALDAALKGKRWNDWKVVEGRSNRKYADDNKVAEVVTSAGLDPFEKKLLSVAELQKRIGKAHFDELVAPHVMKPPGKPTLVPRSDKREELNSAAADFNDEN